MDGPNTIYKMRPIIKLEEEIYLPKCMYKMKVIQNSHCLLKEERSQTNWTSVLTEQKPMPEIVALENRQEEILAELAQLKQQLQNLREQLKQSPVCSYSTLYVPDSHKEDIPEEIVVKANPKFPPYSLLALNRLFQNKINIQTYTHSTVKGQNELFASFESNVPCSPVFNIKLIWKEVPDIELLISPTKHIVISSEVNLLRFLSRLGPPELNYENNGDPALATIADELLDMCNCLVKETKIKAREVYINALGSVLQKKPFLLGSNLSIVDAAGWSAIKQLGLLPKHLPTSINKWIEMCNKMFGDTDHKKQYNLF